MNYKLLYEMEKEENLKLKEGITELRLSFECQVIKTRSYKQLYDGLIQSVEELKAQKVIQNVAPKEKLVERIIIETYEKYI